MDQHQLDHSDSEMDLADTSHSSGVSAQEDSFEAQDKEQSTQMTEVSSQDSEKSSPQDTSSHLRPPEDRARLQGSNPNSRRSVQDLEELVKVLYERYSSPNTNQSEEGEEQNSNRTILASRLPEVLKAFEQQKGQALIDAESFPLLETLALDNPTLELDAGTFISLVTKLEAATESDASQAEITETIQEVISDAPTSSSSSDDDDQSSIDNSLDDDESHSKRTLPRRDSNYRFPSTSSNSSSNPPGDSQIGRKTPEPFERSSTPKRSLTLSDPASPFKGRGGSAPPEDFSKTRSKARKSRERRVSTEERNPKNQEEEKDVIRGKGKLKAPPSAWPRRPAPPAISAGRARRQSSTDLNGNSGAPPSGRSFSFQDESNRAPRQRNISQPTSHSGMADESDEDSMVISPAFPRSVSTGSTGFQFPRATSPSDIERQERENQAWEGLISGVNHPHSSRNPSRSSSPVLDPQSSHFQGFGALSPTYNPLHSSNSHFDKEESNQQRLMLEKELREARERADASEQNYDTDMAAMQRDVDALKDDLESKRKELKQMKELNEELNNSSVEAKERLARNEELQLRDQKTMIGQKARIEKLEADLNRSHIELDDLNKELEHLKGLVGQHEEEASSWMAAKNRVDQINKTLELRLEGANDLGEQLDQLRDQVKHLEEVNQQQANQLEELRNESGHFTHERNLSSLPPSMSARLGSEIARLHTAEALERSKDETRSEVVEDDGDLSTGSVYEIRRTKKSRARLPTYNEAKSAKEIEQSISPIETETTPSSPRPPSEGPTSDEEGGNSSSSWLERQKTAFFYGVSAVVGPKITSSIPGSNIMRSSSSKQRSANSSRGLTPGEAGAAVMMTFALGMAYSKWMFPTYVVSSIVDHPQLWNAGGDLSSPFELGATGASGSVEYGFGWVGKWLLDGTNIIRRVPT